MSCELRAEKSPKLAAQFRPEAVSFFVFDRIAQNLKHSERFALEAHSSQLIALFLHLFHFSIQIFRHLLVFA